MTVIAHRKIFIMDPNENCEQRVCQTKNDFFKMMKHASNKDDKVPAEKFKNKKYKKDKKNEKGKNSDDDNNSSSIDINHNSTSTSVEAGCPADREELGRHTWTLLHTMGAYYPKNPTPKQKEDVKNFLRIFSNFYPCTHCAVGLRENMKKTPPRVENRNSLSIWMCQMHNEVNRLLQKPTFDCSIEKLNKRWKTGEDYCWGGNNINNDINNTNSDNK